MRYINSFYKGTFNIKLLTAIAMPLPPSTHRKNLTLNPISVVKRVLNTCYWGNPKYFLTYLLCVCVGGGGRYQEL